MAREAGLLPNYEVYEDDLKRFATLVAAAEREACAELAEKTAKFSAYAAGEAVQDLIALRIRARGQA
jgi:hypothetical protein